MNYKYFGNFLYSERISKGYDSIKDYLLEHPELPISESYYRDLETGRKIIRLETGEKLLFSLKLDKKPFYYNLLRDILPEEISEEILRPVSSILFNSPSEELMKKEHEIKVLKKAYEKRLTEESYYVNDKIIEYLDEKIELLPVIHYIYNNDRVSFNDIQQLMENNKINIPIDEVLSEFEKHNIAYINWEYENVKRYNRIFKIPTSELGIRLKNKFLLTEVSQTVERKNRDNDIDLEKNFVYSVISSYKSKASLEKLSDKVLSLVAQIEAEESYDKDAMPYFVSVIFSPRENYSV